MQRVGAEMELTEDQLETVRYIAEMPEDRKEIHRHNPVYADMIQDAERIWNMIN